MRSIVVQKYGGSSVADTGRIQKVAERIAETRRLGKEVCVVVSAMGTTTNELLARAREIAPAPSRRELDMLLSCGERASMALLSMAVHELGYEAVSLTGSQSGIITNDRHSGARIIEVRPFRVQDELERGRVVIVAGFQGVSYRREITTLGRGGSDTTAVALAAALGAEHCEICSDVDGVYSADPRLVGAAELMAAISHDEMLELAAHGARVLHAESVELARRFQIALYARATGGGGEGTRIDVPEAAARIHRVAGVSGQKNLVRLRGRGAASTSALLALAHGERLPMHALVAGADEAQLLLALDDVPDWSAVRERARSLIPDLAIDEGLGAVSVVGDFIGRDAGAIELARLAAGEAGLALEGILTSPLRATLLCRADAVDALVQVIHRVLRESP
ncbi:MAG TPA: aspartate kinase [Kofleriaceae bacterium]|nr:aspartate kinase [Kofleriaceae bacterium]